MKLHLVYSFLPYDMTFHLCDLTKKVGHPCPIPKGTLSVSVPTKIPNYAPKVSLFVHVMILLVIDACTVLYYHSLTTYYHLKQGDYQGHIIVTDQNQQELSCIDLKLTL